MWNIRDQGRPESTRCLRTIKSDVRKPAKMNAKDREDLKSKAVGTIRLCLSN